MTVTLEEKHSKLMVRKLILELALMPIVSFIMFCRKDISFKLSKQSGELITEEVIKKGGKDSSVQFFVSEQPILLSKIAKTSEVIPQVDHFPPDQLIVPEGLEVKLWAKSPPSTTPPIWTLITKGEYGWRKGEITVVNERNRTVTGS